MKEHINACPMVECAPLKEDRSNISDFFCADVVGDRMFAQNYGGYPRSDVAEINDQTNLASAEALLSKLQVISVSDANSGLSDAQIMLGHKSKYMQTPSEQIRWLEEQIKFRDIERSKSQPKSEQTIDFTNDSDSSSND